MDVLRSCYSSAWRFFRNAPGTLTKGHYYRVPEDTPPLPFPHFFFSSQWDNNDPGMIHDIGPVPDYPQRWATGELLGTLPPPIPLGTETDFTGELADPANVYTSALRQGIPEVCWTANGFPFVDPKSVAALTSCCLRIAYTRVIDLLYIFDFERVENFFTEWLGPATTFKRIIQAGENPAGIVVRTALYALVFITGTDNFEQAATQAFEGKTPPTNVGGCRSLPIWSRTGDVYFREMATLDVGAAVPVVVVGHSYGGAVAALMAVKMRLASEDRSISVLTFGMPKPGDEAFITILETCNTVFMQNDGDFVTIVPINVNYGFWFNVLVSAVIRNIWGQWAQPNVYLRFREDGTSFEGATLAVSYDILFPLVLRALLGQPLNIGDAHRTGEYLRRQRAFCHGPCWPVPKKPWDILFQDGPAAGLLALSRPQLPMLGNVVMKGQFDDRHQADGKIVLADVLQGLARGGVVLSSAHLARGSLVLHSVQLENFTCESAADIPMPGTMPGTVVSGDGRWYRTPILSSVGYYAKLYVTGGTITAVTVFTGTDCDNANFRFQLSEVFVCNTTMMFEDGLMFLFVDGDGDFVLEVGEGFCP